MLILVKFPDEPTRKKALGKLIRNYSGKSWKTGEVAVPAAALEFLAQERIQFSVIGPAPYDLVTPVRDITSTAV
jgi:hypothetical protein